MRGDRGAAIRSPIGGWPVIEVALAALLGGVILALLIVADRGDTKALAVIGAGLLGLSALVVLARVPGATDRFLLFLLVATLSVSVKFHPIFRADHLGGSIGVRVSITDLLLLLAAAFAIGPALRRGWVLLRIDRAIAVTAGLYLLCAVTSTLASGDRQLGVFQVLALGQSMVVAVWIASREWGAGARRTVMAAILCGVVLQSGVAIAQSVFPGKLQLQFLGAAEYSEGAPGGLPAVDVGATTIAGVSVYRPTGLLIHPNLLAAYLVLTLPIAVAVALCGRSRGERVLGRVAAAGATGALYLSLSRSGWIGAAAAMTIATVLVWRWRAIAPSRALRVSIALACLCCVAGVAWQADRIYRRFTETADQALEFRAEYAQTAWRMAVAHPALGVGLNTFTDHAPQYDASGTSRIKAFPVHNVYLLELAETGFAGGLAFAALVAAIVVGALRAVRQSSPDARVFVIALAAGLMGFWVTQLSDYFYRIPIMTTLVWVHVGLVLGVSRSGGVTER
ncbi:MAG TPA: O-antigen ligase family protein [Vicinamibacterales bacterium]|nr:O-antigen ligase family protein [Vicinamibacterales bacterium]